jgi:glycosyltransferase-like protein
VSPLRIAMLTYSLRPRGGVVHALEVSEALARRGHHVELFALGRPGEEFFREPGVPAKIVRHVPEEGDFDARIEGTIRTYRDGLAEPLRDGAFDIVHAQDCLSSNAALELRDMGFIAELIRTVHHVDDFRSPSLIACQERSIVAPDGVLCVSAPWQRRLERDFGVRALLVRNGVDAARFHPARDAAQRARDRELAELGRRFAVLTVGGIEPRKGSLTLLEAFAELCGRARDSDPLLVVAGGATLFDYREEIVRFHDRVGELGLRSRVRTLGPLAPEALERLYRAADVFAFPSVKEGFGLAAIEALASGLPVVASDLDVFGEFLADGVNALLCPVGDAGALGDRLVRLARDPGLRARMAAAARGSAAAYTWDAAAETHERAYRILRGATDRTAS